MAVSEEGPRSGVLYFIVVDQGIVRFDFATSTSVVTGVSLAATAFGYGGDGYWYANGGGGEEEAKQFYRLLPELVQPDGIDGVPFVQLIGVGTRRIEDIATSPDGGTTYGVGEGFLFSIDRATGVQTDIGSLGFQAYGLAFADPGELVTMDGTRLMQLDPTTGAATFVANFLVAGHDMAGHVEPLVHVPTLSQWGLGALALLLLSGVALKFGRRRATA